MSWTVTAEDGPAKGLSKPHQEPLNLYVHPEPSPELEERLLRDSAAPLPLQAAKANDGTARTLDTQPSGSLELRKDYNYEAQPCLASSPSAAHRDPRVFTLSTAGRSSDSYDGQHSSLMMGCSDSHSLHLGTGHNNVDQDRTECNMDFRQRFSSDAAAATMAAPQAQVRNLDPQQPQQPQPQQQPSTSERAWPQSACLQQQNPEDGSGAPLAAFDPMQADYGGCKSPSTCPTREGAAVGTGGELISVHSLSLSGPERDLLDQLLGEPSEPGAGSPPLVTPSSFLATGPFADASLQPALSDYSQRPTPAQQLADHLEAEADSAMRHQNKSGGGGAHQQAPLASAYSEPLPFSAPLPHHLALHPPCPAPGAPVGGPPAAAADTGRTDSGATAEGAAAAAGQYHPPQREPHKGPHKGAETGAQHWAGGQGDGRGSGGYESLEPAQQHQQQMQQQGQMQQQQMQQQQMSYQRPHSATHVNTPYSMSQSVRSLNEPGLLPPAHSAPVPGMAASRQPSQQLKPGNFASSGGAASPMHVDAPSRPQQGYAAFANGGGGTAAAGALSASAGSTMDVGGGQPAAACANPASSAGGPYPAPMQSSPSDSRGKRLRQHNGEGRPAAAAPVLPPAHPPAHVSAPPPQSTASAGGGGATAARASSPSSHSQSAGDPMSVSGMEGAAMYGQGPGYPYPYSMPPPYPMSYGMPYGDTYYHPGYGYHPMMDAPPPPAGPDAMAGGYGGPHNPQLHYPGFMAPRQRLYRRFVTGPHGRRDGAGQASDAPLAAGQGQEGLMSMASAPAGSVSIAPPAMHPGSAPARQQQQPAPSSSAATAPRPHEAQCYPGARPGPGTGSYGFSCGGGGAAAMDTQGAGPADHASAGGAAQGHMMHMQQAGAAGAAPGGPLAAAPGADMESSMAARACHEQFASDDMPLPLPRSTVDGIRQELRVVTQEFLQRRMDLARSKQLQAAAAAAAAANGDGGPPPRLQPSNSWTAGDAMSSMSGPTAPATAPLSQQYPPHYPHYPQHSGLPPSHSVDGYSHSMAMAYPPIAAAGGGGGGGGLSTSASLPHKRGASAGLSAGGAVSPVRARPAPSAPTAAHSAPLASVRGVATSGVRRSAEGFPSDTVTAPLMHGGMGPEPGAMGGGVGPGPSAMRQLFPPPAPGGAAGGGHFGNGVGGPGGSYGVPGGGGGAGGKPPQSAPAVSAPLGPRPAMSGKSSASATHSVSVAQMAPVRGAMQQQQHQQQQQLQQQQQQQQKGAGLMAMGSYRVGQQGSMAAEVEDDGEEVHGPPQRSSANRPTGPPAAVSSSACGPPSMPMPPSYYGGAVPPPPYDYPPGYYYPSSYGMRMYGMPPPSVPPGYRPPPSSGVAMYGMPPPAMPYPTGAGAVPPPWPEYGAPGTMPQGGPMPQVGPGGGSMTHGSSGGMSAAAHMRGGSAAGGVQASEYMQQQSSAAR